MDIGEIESRRLHELQRQAARFGPQTEPAILIEIQELQHKHRTHSESRRDFVSGLDYDFLMNVMAAALLRLGLVEAALTNDGKKRFIRQLIHDLWMVMITVMVFITLFLQLTRH